MAPYWQEHFGNPASFHWRGTQARKALIRAREQVASFLGSAHPEDIIFTSDGTESINFAVQGMLMSPRRRGHQVVTSALEHPAVQKSIAACQTGRDPIQIAEIAPLPDGTLPTAAYEAAITSRTTLVSTHWVNQDLGTIQSAPEIVAAARSQGVPVFVDGEAAVGWVNIQIDRFSPSLFSCSAHRFGGPRGVGILYHHRRTSLTPMLHGGDQESGLRAGIENVPAIVGAGVAAEIATREWARHADTVRHLQRYFWEAVKARIPGAHLHGPEPGPTRTPQSLCFSFSQAEGEGLTLFCDLQGLEIHAGAACLARGGGTPPALAAIGVPPNLGRGAILVSFGPTQTVDELDQAIVILAKGVERLRSMALD